jgi:diguanylate cyclase (GGDEF)-like protein/PAS domain S-box-containing protein
MVSGTPDISSGGELMTAQREALRRQSFIDALLETIDVGIVSCDADGVFVVSNLAERTMFGLDTDLGGKPMDYLGPRIKVYERDGTPIEVDRYPLMRALRGENVSNLEVLAGPADGPYRQLQVRARQIVTEGGEVIGAVAALTDVTSERAAATKLANEHRRLAEAQRLGKIGSFEHDFHTDAWTFSEHLAVLWGIPPDTVGPAALADLIHDEDRAAAVGMWDAARREGGAHSTELRIRRPADGRERLLRVNLEVDLDPTGSPRQARGAHLDITDLSAAEAEARQANIFLHAVLAASPDLTFVSNAATGEIIYGSPTQQVLGITNAELTSMGVEGFMSRLHPDDRPPLRDAVAKASLMGSGQVATVQYRSRHREGSERWISHRITPFRVDEHGRATEILSVLRDVTELVDAEHRLAHAAHHDYLTGLPNRATLIEQLNDALTVDEEIAVLFCDLDGFKAVNDIGGHSAGDAVLVACAQRLLGAVRDADLVARVGGDEFVILIRPGDRVPSPGQQKPGESVRTIAVGIVRRIAEQLDRPITVAGALYRVTASVGITYATGSRPGGAAPTSADAVLRSADSAMYTAKSRGKGRHYIASGH